MDNMIAGLTQLLSSGQKNQVDPLYGEASDQEAFMAELHGAVADLEIISKSGLAIENSMHSVKALADSNLKENAITSKLNATAADVLKLSAPNGLGFLYLGNVINSSFSSLRKNINKNQLTSGLFHILSKDNKETDLNKEDLGKTKEYSFNEFIGKHSEDVIKKDGLLGIISSSIFGATAGVSAASLSQKALSLINPTTLGITGLIASIGWGISDGLRGVAKSAENDTSKLSGFLGGFLGGSGPGGLGSAFAGAGKFAMMGASIGLLGGPVGVLAGGILGAALGGVLGFIGADNLAKGFDKIGLWFKNKWNAAKENTVNTLKDFAEGFALAKQEWSGAFNSLKSSLQGGFESVKGFFENLNLKDKFNNVSSKISGKVSETMSNLVEGFNNVKGHTIDVKNSISDKIGGAVGSLTSGFSSLKEKASEVATEKFDSVKKGLNNTWDIVESGFSNLKNFSIKDINVSGILGESYERINTWLGNAFDGVSDFLKGNSIGEAVSDLYSKVSGIFNIDFSNFSVGDLVTDKIIKPISTFFSGISDTFSFLKSYFEKGFLTGIKNLSGDLLKGDFEDRLADYKKDKQYEEIKKTPAYSKFINSKEYKESSKADREYLSNKYIDSQLTKVKDGIFKTTNFQLESSLGKGALFDGNNKVQIDEEDDLYLMAATNVPTDKISEKLEILNSLIDKFINVIGNYNPQVNNHITNVIKEKNAIKELLEMA